VWLGYDRPASIGAAASDLAAPLWGWWIGRIARPDGPPPRFDEPVKLERRWLCSITGKLSREGCKGVSGPFLPGTAPREVCTRDHTEDFAEKEPEVEGAPPAHESLWKRLAREKAEAEAARAAEAGATPPAAPSP
jgi:membrane carboxypeptidase/penicillin-binding protein